MLLLIETWINNEENIDDTNVHCIAKLQRHNHRAGGVIIYKNEGDMTTYVTSETDVAPNTSESFGFNQSYIGEICAAKCRADNGQTILMIIYISSNQSVEKIIKFIHKKISYLYKSRINHSERIA
ncbi:ATP-dependent DNA helicase [Trichonephila clavipes]|nr:ATP-dependent DNA helicase [Trichonephila clavipes]